MRVDTLAAGAAALFLAACMFGHTVAARLLLLGLGVILASLAVARSKGDIRALPPVWIPFALWAAWAALSLAWSLEPERTSKEWRNEVFYTGAGLWICFVGAQARHAARLFPAILSIAALATCAIALGEFSYGFDYYLVGWHGGPGDHSSALLALMPCVAIAGWYASRAGWPLRASFAIWGLAAFMLASAYATLNRTLWLGFAVQFVVLGVLLLLRTPPLVLRDARTKLAAAALAVTVVVGCGAVLLNIQAERETIGAQPIQRDPRFALWPEIIGYIQARPLTGHGFGRGVLRDHLQQEFKDIDRNLWHAHNILLEALLQLGIPGLALLLVLLAAIVRAAWRFARDADESSAACGIALLGVVAGMLVRNMTDTLLVRQNALLFWGLVGVLLAWGAKSWRASS